MPTSRQEQRRLDPRWTIVRVLLGLAQSLGVTCGLLLGFTGGFGAAPLAFAALAALALLLSFALFGWDIFR